jgi:hypothetical protein
MNDVVDRPCRWAGDFEAVHPLDERLQDGRGLHPCQGLSRAGMRPLPEADMSAGIAADVEHGRFVPLAFVAVGRRIHDENPIPGCHSDAADFGLLAHAARERPQRRPYRTTSLMAFDIRSGSSLSNCHCSGWVANKYSALLIALIVVSIDGAR